MEVIKLKDASLIVNLMAQLDVNTLSLQQIIDFYDYLHKTIINETLQRNYSITYPMKISLLEEIVTNDRDAFCIHNKLVIINNLVLYDAYKLFDYRVPVEIDNIISNYIHQRKSETEKLTETSDIFEIQGKEENELIVCKDCYKVEQLLKRNNYSKEIENLANNFANMHKNEDYTVENIEKLSEQAAAIAVQIIKFNNLKYNSEDTEQNEFIPLAGLDEEDFNNIKSTIINMLTDCYTRKTTRLAELVKNNN